MINPISDTFTEYNEDKLRIVVISDHDFDKLSFDSDIECINYHKDGYLTVFVSTLSVLYFICVPENKEELPKLGFNKDFLRTFIPKF